MVDEIPVLPGLIVAFVLWCGVIVHIRRTVVKNRKELRESRTASK